MRGALDRITGGLGYGRIIPADAGSTRIPRPEQPLTQDHPRGCGEHGRRTTGLKASSRCRSGSSPRMRGAQDGDLYVYGCRGIIPADAGSTEAASSSWMNLQDHPRGCGEHWLWTRVEGSYAGSSPRMRGALRQPWRLSIRMRIIPADAGSTNGYFDLTDECVDHPRGCGEHHK